MVRMAVIAALVVAMVRPAMACDNALEHKFHEECHAGMETKDKAAIMVYCAASAEQKAQCPDEPHWAVAFEYGQAGVAAMQLSHNSDAYLDLHKAIDIDDLIINDPKSSKSGIAGARQEKTYFRKLLSKISAH